MRKRGQQRSRKESATADYPHCMDAALRLLSYRPRAEAEIERRLLDKGFREDVVRRACRRLRRLRYIDDRQFARAWIKGYSGSRCRSEWVLKQELRKKGIAPELADRVMAEDFDREKVFEAACRLVRQRMRGGSSDAVKQTARLQNLLLRRGFDYDFVREVLSKTIAGARTAEDAECTDAL